MYTAHRKSTPNIFAISVIVAWFVGLFVVLSRCHLVSPAENSEAIEIPFAFRTRLVPVSQEKTYYIYRTTSGKYCRPICILYFVFVLYLFNTITIQPSSCSLVYYCRALCPSHNLIANLCAHPGVRSAP